MRIGVVTFWQSADNFGQILQGYALQRALKAMGNAPVLIRTERDQSSLPFSRKIKLFIHGFFQKHKDKAGGFIYNGRIENKEYLLTRRAK